MADMQHVSIKHLNIGDLKVRDAINHNIASVVLLSPSLCVETRLVEDNTENRVCWNVLRRLEKGLPVVYCLDACINVADAFG